MGISVAGSTEEYKMRAMVKWKIQIWTLFCRAAAGFFGDKKKVAVSLLMPFIIGFIIVLICRNGNIGVLYEDTRFTLFIIVAAAIYMGMFNSLALVCKERAILKREYITGMSLGAYIVGTMLFQMMIVAVEGALFGTIYWYGLGLDFGGEAIMPMFVMAEFIVTIVLIMMVSDALGILVSCLAPTAEITNLIAPAIAVVQLVLSGVLFNLTGWKRVLSFVTVSKWGMDSLGSILNILALDRRTVTYLDGQVVAMFPNLNGFTDTEIKIYEHTIGHLIITWGALIVLAVVICIACVVFLKLIKYDKR